MVTAVWQEIAPTYMEIDLLVPTQKTVQEAVRHKIDYPFSSASGDPLPHVIEWKGNFYILDGHHRIKAKGQQGHRVVVCRVLTGITC